MNNHFVLFVSSDGYLQPIQSMFVVWYRILFGYLGLPANLSAHQSYKEPKSILISWENIFYNNRNNDFTNILRNIGQTGIFLIRPQLKKMSSNDYVRLDLNCIISKDIILDIMCLWWSSYL